MPHPKVILPRRFKADAADSAITTLMMLGPLFAFSAASDVSPLVL